MRQQTLAEVMLMLVRADAGEMDIDGHRVDEALASNWRNQAAYVPQDVVLFDDGPNVIGILKNLLYGTNKY